VVGRSAARAKAVASETVDQVTVVQVIVVLEINEPVAVVMALAKVVHTAAKNATVISPDLAVQSPDLTKTPSMPVKKSGNSSSRILKIPGLLLRLGVFSFKILL
jgi:hypothetical protein